MTQTEQLPTGYITRPDMQEAIDAIADAPGEAMEREGVLVALSLLNLTLAIVRIRETGGIARLRESGNPKDGLLADLLDKWAREPFSVVERERDLVLDDLAAVV